MDEGRDPEAVAAAAEATAGQGGTDGVEGHTGTTLTDPPLGGADSSGIDTDGRTHEEAAGEQAPADDDETDAEGENPEGDENADDTDAEGDEGHQPAGDPNPADDQDSSVSDDDQDADGSTPTGSDGGVDSEDGAGAATPLPKPSNGASKDAWIAWATDPNGGGKSAADIEGLGRDAIRDLFA